MPTPAILHALRLEAAEAVGLAFAGVAVPPPPAQALPKQKRPWVMVRSHVAREAYECARCGTTIHPTFEHTQRLKRVGKARRLVWESEHLSPGCPDRYYEGGVAEQSPGYVS